jgi:hypothetical protein
MRFTFPTEPQSIFYFWFRTRSISLDESERPRNWLRGCLCAAVSHGRAQPRSRAALPHSRAGLPRSRSAPDCRAATQPTRDWHCLSIVDILRLSAPSESAPGGRRKPAASEGGQDTSRTRRIWQVFSLLCQSVNLSVHHWPRPVTEPGPVETWILKRRELLRWPLHSWSSKSRH